MAKAKAKKKKNPEYELIEKRSKRWAVLSKDGKYINGEEKVAILIKEGKIKVEKPKKKKVEEPVEEVALSKFSKNVEEEAKEEEPEAEMPAIPEEAPAEEAPAEEAAAEGETKEKAE